MDKLFNHESATVKDLIDQAIVAAEIVNEESADGPLEQMFLELIDLRRAVEQMTYDINLNRSGDYWRDSGSIRTVWTNTTKTQGYVYDPITQTPIKVSSGTGT